VSDRLRIGLIPFKKNGWMGGELYIRTLSNGITMAAKQDEQDVIIDMPAGPIAGKAVALGRMVAARTRLVPLTLCNPGRYDFVYPCYTGKRAPYKWGAWIPDFQEIYLPQFFSPEVVERRRALYSQAAKYAPVIVLSSQNALDDFLNLHPEAAERCRVMTFPSYPASDWLTPDPIEVQKKYELADRFFIVCNQFWMHKDHKGVFKALSILKEQGIRPQIAFTGHTIDDRNPAYFGELTELIETYGIGEQVKILGLIPRLDQVQLLRRSLAVIQPSLFEGWSTVVEDARALSKPILLSDFPVHVEQNPPYARFFTRGNHEELAELIKIAYEDLEPGPDHEREKATVAQSYERTVEMGRTFIQIARSTLEKPLAVSGGAR